MRIDDGIWLKKMSVGESFGEVLLFQSSVQPWMGKKNGVNQNMKEAERNPEHQSNIVMI